MIIGKTIALAIQTFVGKVMSLLLNMLSRLVIAFLPRSKRLLISWLQSPSAGILEPKKIVCHCFHFFPIYLPWSDGTRCHGLSFLMLSFKPTFSLSFFTFIKRVFSSSSVQFSHSVVSDSLRPHESQHARPLYHPEFTQTHVHRVGDAIQPSHPLSTPSPPAPNPSQHQGLAEFFFTFCHKGGVICISEAIDISPNTLDSRLYFIQPGISHDALCI